MNADLKNLTILQLSDLHILSEPKATFLGVDTMHYFQECLKLAFSMGRHFDLMLLTGDLAQEPVYQTYQRILSSLKDYSDVPCICLPGNHDDFGLMQQAFVNDAVNCRKQITLGRWQIINLNSQIPGKPAGRLAESELSFLEQCLENFPQQYAFIAVHHHCVKTNSSWMDTMMIENSDELFAHLARFPQVKLITSGHIHQVLDINLGQIRVLGTPSTCFQFEPGCDKFSVVDTAPGFRLFQLGRDGGISTEIVRLPVNLAGVVNANQIY
ncbi:MAG: 3',5'-cyclic-AMP phosphodiesterase [Methylococcaceae bacterium]|nr:3',5'-cyclic-AMP phosphodiesterase [Methylococcaceae bacterium]